MQTLFKIEEEYVSTALYNLKITGYSDEEVAYHCKLLFENELISDYKDIYADNRLYSFGVGSLTWEGHDFIDKIREDTVWNKRKNVANYYWCYKGYIWSYYYVNDWTCNKNNIEKAKYY